MSDTCVIDSSIGFSWVYAPQASPVANELLDELEKGAVLVVPLLWFTEMANGLLVLERRKKMLATDRKKALTLLEGLNLQVDEEASRAVFHDTSELASLHGLTVYDAIYLETALRRKSAIATRDALLRQAAEKCHLTVRG